MVFSGGELRKQFTDAILWTSLETNSAELVGDAKVPISEIGRQKMLGFVQLGGNLGVFTKAEFLRLAASITKQKDADPIGIVLVDLDPED